MKKLKIAFVLLCSLSLFEVNAQTLTPTGNYTITGNWNFNGEYTYNLKNTLLINAPNNNAFQMKNTNLDNMFIIGLSDSQGAFYSNFAKAGDVVLRRQGSAGEFQRIIIGNNYPLNDARFTKAATGILGSGTGYGVWAHNNGFVRIGNYNVEMPSEQLEVAGNITFGYARGRSIIWESSLASNGYGHKIYNSDPGHRTLLNIAGRHNSKEWTDIVKITSNGLVGIGIVDIPTAALDVNGTIRANEIKITKAPGADFVFDADYSLRTLDEVEAFINENSHLPEIPTALEMETNGVELTKMNQLLLMKIEELTLYLIQQKKEIEELNALINTFVSESK